MLGKSFPSCVQSCLATSYVWIPLVASILSIRFRRDEIQTGNKAFPSTSAFSFFCPLMQFESPSLETNFWKHIFVAWSLTYGIATTGQSENYLLREILWGTPTNGVAPGGVDRRELVRKRAVVTEVGAGGARQDAIVNPAVDSDADAEQLTFADALEGAILNVHHQALSWARHLRGPSAKMTLTLSPCVCFICFKGYLVCFTSILIHSPTRENKDISLQ